MRKLLIGLVTVVSAWAALYGASAGKVLDLGGTSGKSGVRTDVPLSEASFTLECWVRMHSWPASGEAALISHYASYDGRIQFGIKNKEFAFFKGTRPGWVSSGYSVPLDEWVHLAFTQEKEGRWRWYVNGALKRSLRLYDDYVPAHIGARIAIGNLIKPGDTEFSSSSLAADIADVRVWNRARTSQEIADDWNRRLTGKEAGLAGYWRLDDYSLNEDQTEGTVTNLANGQSCRVILPATGKDCDDLVFVDTPAPKPVYHKGRSLRFDPSKDRYAAVETSTKITTTACTLECWVNVNSYSESGSGERYFFSQYPGKGRFLMGDWHGGNWKAFKGDCLPGPSVWTGPGVKLPLKKWTHLAFTQDANGLWTFYMDGKNVGTVQSDTTVFPGNNIVLGNSINGSVTDHAADARMSEARVWNYARSEAEIQASMNLRLTGKESGLIGCWPLDDADGKVRNLVNGKEETMRGGLAFEEDDADPLAFEGSQGALSNIRAQSFVNTDLSISSTNFTLEAWVRYTGKTDVDATSETYLLSQYSGNTGRFWWGVQSGKIAAFVGGRDGALSSDYSITNGVWAHLAYVHDAGRQEWRFYVDGVCVKAIGSRTPNALDNVKLNLLGRDPSLHSVKDVGFPGMVRDLRIWNVARSGYEISSCRTNRLSGTESGLYAYFPMDEDRTAVKEMVNGKEYAFGGVSKVEADATTFAAPEKKHPAMALAIDADGLGSGYVPTDISLTTADFTLETMVYWSGDASESLLASQRSKNHVDNRTLFGISGGKPFFRLGGTELVANVTLEANTWTHLAAVRDSSAGELRLYADGRLVGSCASQSSAPTSAATFTLGGYHHIESEVQFPDVVYREYKGYFTEFRAWSVARTVGEIRQNRYGRLKDLPELPANLTGYWPLDGEDDVRGAVNLVTGVCSPAINAWQEFDEVFPLRKMGLFIVVK